MKFKAMYKYPNEKDVVIGVFDERDKAIEACLNYRNGDYCVDDREMYDRWWSLLKYAHSFPWQEGNYNFYSTMKT